MKIGKGESKDERYKHEDWKGGIPSREAQCTPYAAGQGAERGIEKKEWNWIRTVQHWR